MEYDDPNESYPRSPPPLVPRKLPLNGPERFAPWVLGDQEEPSTHDAPGGNTTKASSFTHDNSPNLRILAQRRARKRLGLPLVVFTAAQEESVIACPDSGSDDNIMSRDIAEKLKLPIQEVQDSSPSAFVLANGRTVSAVGEVRVKCAFKQGSPATALIECVFYVFQTLAVPMIMGFQFLQVTETLTKYRDRLVEELVPSTQALRVCSVGRPKRDVVCRVGNYVGCATADTGSELDLVSPEFAASRAFDVEDMCVELEFADGSTGYTMGMIITAFSIGRVSDVEGFVPRSKTISLELFVLENLNADVLVSTDTVQDLQAFSSHEDCFIPAIPRLGQSDLNIIRYIGAAERGLSKAWEFVKDSCTSSGKKQATTTNQNHKRKRLEQQDQLLQDQLENRNHLRFTETSPRQGLPRTELPLQSQRDHLGLETLSSNNYPSTPDQARNPMPMSARSVFPPSAFYQSPESPAHRNNMDLAADLIAHPGSGSYDSRPVSSQYHCTFEESKASPLDYTQPRLKSPANIHSQARPYYCPVKGCWRSEGRIGFEQKSEMIRHGLVVHDSLGYLCPFCPDRKHKYPRPENLQRHVRVYHQDIDADDVLLRDVLSQPL